MSNAVFTSGHKFQLHIANGNYWAVIDQDTIPGPTVFSSPDAINWTSQGSIFISFGVSSSTNQWATRFSGNTIIAFAYDSSNRYYRKGTLMSDGSVTWDTPETAAGPAATGTWPALNALILNGRPIMWRNNNLNTDNGILRRGDRLSPTPIAWADTLTNAPPLNPPTQGGLRSAALFPLGGDAGPDDLIILRATTTSITTPGYHYLVSVKYNGALDSYDSAPYNVSLCCGLTETTQTQVRAATDDAAQPRFAAARDTSGRIHAVYVNNQNRVVHYRKAAGWNDTWSRISADVIPSFNINKVALTSADLNNLYLFYSKNDDRVYYKRFSPTGWGPENTVKSNTTPIHDSLGSMEMASGCSVGVAWAEETATYATDNNQNAMFQLITGDCPSAVSLSSFEARGADEAVELSWETGSEMNNLGFHLYRAPAEEGPYERITASVIPGLGSSPEGAHYRYVDQGLANGVTRFYKLEDIETTGLTTLHGPVSATPQAGAVFSAGGDGGSEGPGAPSLITYGNPSANRLEVLYRSETEAVLELITEGFYAEPLEDGTVRLSVPGFEPVGEPGSPSLPVKRPWVEAVAGLGVELISVEERRIAPFTGLVPSGASKAEAVGSREGQVRLELRAPAVGSGERWAFGLLYPREAARVLETGYQGEVKKVQVELAPLKWDGANGRLLLARRLVVRLGFEGKRRRETSLGGARGRLYPSRASHSRRAVVARLATREPGLHVVSHQEVLRGGGSVRAGGLLLSRLGKPVAFHIEPEPNRFGPGSRLYFLSEGAEANPYGDETVYELELRTGGVRMARGEAPPVGEPASHYRKRLEQEVNRYYQAALLTAEDLWLWDVLMAPVRKSFPFQVRGLASTVEASRLSVWLQGASDFAADPDHHLRVYLNGSLLGEVSWNGKMPQKVEVGLPSGVLVEGENFLELENVGDTGASYSMAFLDRFTVEYPRILEAEGGRLEGSFSRAAVAEVSGIGSSGYVVDVTDEAAPVWLEGVESTGAGALRFRAGEGRSYRVVGAEFLRRPEVRRPAASQLKSRGNGADYVVVGPEVFLDESQALLELRRDQGLRVRAVSVEKVYEEFGFGEERPEAIREFLEYAYHQWEPPALRYVLLLGDGTYDFKDYLGTGVVNRVPPLLAETSYLWTASDPTLGAVNGEDWLPDVAIGRLPAANENELQRMVEKILAYETGGANLSSSLVLVADNPDSAGDFVANAEAIASGVLSGREVRKLYLTELGASAMRTAILNAFDEGASLMSYIGHGGIHLWAHENLFNTGNVASLSPQAQQQPLFVTINCLNGYFHFPYFNSLSEEVLKAEGKGAIAAFSPTGLSLNEPAHLFHEALLRQVFPQGRQGHGRLGDAVLAAQAAYAATGAFPELLRIYHLLGDPALTLK